MLGCEWEVFFLEQERVVKHRSDDMGLSSVAEDAALAQNIKDTVSSPALHPTKAPFTFAVKHAQGPVTYDAGDFVHKNYNPSFYDFVPLFRGSLDQVGSTIYFLSELFAETRTDFSSHIRQDPSAVTGHISLKRRPTHKGEKKKSLQEKPQIVTVFSQLEEKLKALTQTLGSTQPRWVFCINPNDNQEHNKFDSKKVRSQVDLLGLQAILTQYVSMGADYTTLYTYDDFFARYRPSVAAMGLDDNRPAKIKAEAFMLKRNWSRKDMVVGESCIVLSPAHGDLSKMSSVDKIMRNDVRRRRVAKHALMMEVR